MIIIKNLLAIGVVLSAIILGACNGESKVEKVEAEVSVELEQTNLLVQEQKELEKVIAKETGIEEESVKVMLIPISDGRSTEIACSVVLSTENNPNEKTVQHIVKNITTTVSDIKNTKLSEEKIVITNAKGEILN